MISHSTYKDYIALLGQSGRQYFVNVIQIQGNDKILDKFFKVDEPFYKIAMTNENYVILIKSDTQ